MKTLKQKILSESINLPIEIGDILYGGRFKNKKVEVKEIGKDKYNQPTINGKPLLKFRIKKIMKTEEEQKLRKIIRKEIRNIIFREQQEVNLPAEVKRKPWYIG